MDKIRVTDIYDHANRLCLFKYPKVNYNFPRVIYDKHSGSEKGWEVFNKFLNDRNENGFVDNNEDGSDWEEKLEDKRTDADKFHKNRNIIHPMPYVLYVLEKGFSAAGYELSGDILNDKDLLQRVVYAPNANYCFASENDTKSVKIEYTPDPNLSGDKVCVDFLENVFIKKGAYLLRGQVFLNKYARNFAGISSIEILINNEKIYSKEKRHEVDLEIDLDIPFENIEENGELKIKITTYETRNKAATVADLQIDLRQGLNKDGEKIKTLINRNSFSLADFVPDMTFGNFVRTLKNWKNYDIDVKGN